MSNEQLTVSRRQKGQTLLELVVALGIGLIIVSSITVTVMTSLSSAQFNRDQSLATSYAQEGMENVRKLRDQGWVPFSLLNGTYCVGKTPPFPSDSSNKAASCTTVNIGTTFIREIIINNGAGTQCEVPAREVVVRVKWRDGKCSGSNYCHKVELKSCLNNIYSVPNL